jgi:uncharacterized membrane protein
MPFAKCNCTNCSGHIEFDTVHVGQQVNCPHCGLDTVLFAPPSPARLRAIEGRSRLKRLILIAVLGILAAVVVIYLGINYLWQLGAVAGVAIPGLLGVAILVLVIYLAVMWLLFPVVVYRELRRANETLDQIQKNTQPTMRAQVASKNSP